MKVTYVKVSKSTLAVILLVGACLCGIVKIYFNVDLTSAFEATAPKVFVVETTDGQTVTVSGTEVK